MKIETETEYNIALLEIDDLLESDRLEDQNRLEELIKAVVEYEEINFPIPPPSPEEIEKFIEEQNGD